jgi:mediator of RNA polymerase II transcription subunit 14
LDCRVIDIGTLREKVTLSFTRGFSYRALISIYSELKKFGPSARGWLYIQLSNFPSHYLVLVIADDEFRYALISVETPPDTIYGNFIMKDIGWLDIRRLHGENVVVPAQPEQPDSRTTGQKRKRDVGDEGKEKGKPG